jgi:hypothetical protein
MVAKQVHAAWFLPAQDMHPEQLAQLIPKALQGLSPALLSKALDGGQSNDLNAIFDSRRLPHRLSLLPRKVLESLSLNLGMLMHASFLRQVVLRQDLQALAQGGVDEATWTMVFANAANTPSPEKTFSNLPRSEVARWPSLLREVGEQSLLALSNTLPRPLGQRLRWKLPVHSQPGTLPQAPLLAQAYATSVNGWCPDWDERLTQAVS